MKKLLSLVALGMAITFSAFAQEEGQHRHHPEWAADTTQWAANHHATEMGDLTIVSVSPHILWSWDKVSEHMSFLYFSFAFAGDKNFPLHAVNSWEWGMYPLSGTILHSRDHRKLLTWGLGFSRTSYKLKDQAPCLDSHGGLESKGFVSQRLRYWSWRLPICAEFQSADHKNALCIGLEAELRHHVRARDYGDADPQRYHILGLNKDAVNPWGCNLILQAGHNGCGLIARMSLTDLFDDNSPEHFKATPFTVGFALGF